MIPKQKAEELLINLSFLEYDQAEGRPIKGNPSILLKSAVKQCALLCCDEKYNSIIYVAGELKARGELSSKAYLKVLNDMNDERQQVKEEIEKLLEDEHR